MACSWVIDDYPLHECGDDRFGRYALIFSLHIPKGERGKGKGREELCKVIVEIRNQHPAIPVKLIVGPYDDGPNTDTLVSFYESVGFYIEGYDSMGRPVMNFLDVYNITSISNALGQKLKGNKNEHSTFRTFR